MNIAIAEDDQVIGKALSKGLIEAGHQCLWFKDGPNAQEGLQSKVFDIILLDLMLPGVPGLQILKRYRTADCAVIGVAGDVRSPKLVLGLRHDDGKLHHLGVTRELRSDQTTPIQHLFERLGPQEGAIPSRWQHDAVPPWRRVPIEVVCEVRIGLIDNGRWLRQPATFLRWRPDRTPHDCYLEQLS